MSNEEIVTQIQNTEDEEEKRDLYEALYEQNTGLIGKIASRYAWIADMADLKQQAFFGIVKAAAHYDPSLGASFATYAFQWIRAELNRYLQDCGCMIRIPAHELKLLGKYRRLITGYETARGRRPTDEEACYLLDISYEQLMQLQKAAHQIRVRSIDEPVPGTDDLTMADTLPDPEDRIRTAEDRILFSRFWDLIDTLPEDEARAVRLKYLEEMSKKDMAAEMELTANEVQAALDRAFRKLRSGKLRRKLWEYLADEAEYSAYHHSGLAEYMRTGTSSVEKAILEIERYKAMLMHSVLTE